MKHFSLSGLWAILLFICFLAIPFSGLYETYKIHTFGDIKYVTVKKVQSHVLGGRYPTLTHELLIEEGRVGFTYSGDQLAKMKPKDKLPIHYYKSTDNQVEFEIYTSDLDNGFFHLYFSSTSLLILIPSILFFLLLIYFFIFSYARMTKSTLKILRGNEEKDKAILAKSYLTAFFPILIGLLLTALISKAIILNIARTESHGSFIVGLYLLIAFILTLLTPFLIQFGIKKYHEGNHKVLRIIQTLLVAIGMLNVLIVIIQALFDDDPNNFTFFGLINLLIQNYESLLG